MKRLFLLAPLLLFFGCATGTVKPQLQNPAFQAANQPIRTLSLIVASDNSFSRRDIRTLIARASQSLTEQTGIALVIKSWQPVTWKTSRDRVKMLNQLVQAVWGKEYDLAVGFHRQGFGEAVLDNLLQTCMVPTWQGVIDDTFRRYIVIKSDNFQVLEHELCHAFIWEHAHSGSGLMAGMRVKLLPFTPALGSSYLSPQDRQLVLQHKWRKFNDRQIAVTGVQDRITWQPALASGQGGAVRPASSEAASSLKLTAPRGAVLP